MFNIIPPDVASRQKQVSDSALSAVASVRKLKDALADLVPGQRLLAQIQSLLPNGTYRAIVAQKEIVLALPNLAKPGDSLELEVVENDGQIAFALVQQKSAKQGESALDSVATSLSKTGKLISDLLTPPDSEGRKPASLVLNNNQPIIASSQISTTEIAPALKQSIAQSGMFYESHQAAWAEGKLPTAALLAEPQGQFSSPQTLLLAQQNPDANPFEDALHRPIADLSKDQLAQLQADGSEAHTKDTPTSDTTSVGKDSASFVGLPTENRATNQIPQSLSPIIQQQLEAFASQNYSWQGVAWPGQQMEWEITEEADHGQSQGDEDAYRWQTNLKLRLPALGDLAATIRLRGANKIDVQLSASSPDAEIQLSLGGPALNQQMEDAGLYLASFGVVHADEESSLDINE